ncbi:MAG: cupin [Alphaproteobacteria bacterium]
MSDLDREAIVIGCEDFDAALAFYTEELGFRLDMIMPADSPRTALLSGYGIRVRLLGGARPTFARSSGDWAKGRAGMEYRDLIPDRCGGRFIASHIRILGGGPVPDYVHYHKIRFQMIYCRRGWVRAVYEDQGPPFVMNAGDCVLQPPEIRHRVLECSPGLEVIEVGCPAEHETWRDHDLPLPTNAHRPNRDFGGQRFVRHIAAEAVWTRDPAGAFGVRDTGIGEATRRLAGVRVLRMAASAGPVHRAHAGEFLFYYVLNGGVRTSDGRDLQPDDTVLVPAGAQLTVEAFKSADLLEVSLPAVATSRSALCKVPV